MTREKMDVGHEEGFLTLSVGTRRNESMRVPFAKVADLETGALNVARLMSIAEEIASAEADNYEPEGALPFEFKLQAGASKNAVRFNRSLEVQGVRLIEDVVFSLSPFEGRNVRRISQIDRIISNRDGSYSHTEHYDASGRFRWLEVSAEQPDLPEKNHRNRTLKLLYGEGMSQIKYVYSYDSDKDYVVMTGITNPTRIVGVLPGGRQIGKEERTAKTPSAPTIVTYAESNAQGQMIELKAREIEFGLRGDGTRYFNSHDLYESYLLPLIRINYKKQYGQDFVV